MKRKASRQYRVLAVVWSFAAIWWTAYLRASKAEKPYQPKKDSEEKKHER